MVLGALNGLRVLESSAFIAAPLAGMTLAQFGADVIRIDPIGGGLDYNRYPVLPGGRSLYWTGLNKYKRSVAVDIGRPEGRELVQALATAPGEGGGIVLTNLGAPWLSHSTLSERRADLISCTIEGSSDGRTAVDYTVNCATGIPAITGPDGHYAPVNQVLPAWDVICAHQAALAIAIAGISRRLNGAGSELRLALSDTAFSTLSNLGFLAEAELLHRDRAADGNFLYGAFGRDFVTADSERVYIAAITKGQWSKLVRACEIGEEIQELESTAKVDLTREADRYGARDAIASIVQRWCSSRTFQTIEQRFGAFGVLWGRYETMRTLVERDARVSTQNPVFQFIHTAGVGRHLAAGTPIRDIGLPRNPIRAAPRLGEHTDEVLMDLLGLTSAAVGRLHDNGTICGSDADAPTGAMRAVWTETHGPRPSAASP